MSTQLPNLELISFSLCPYVQRSVIMLKQKNLPFQLTFIDLANPPLWFQQIAPLGSVPVLKVRNPATDKTTVLFESTVINEYLDEITSSTYSTKDPLHKAYERSWIAVSSEMLGYLYQISYAQSLEDTVEPLQYLWETFAQVEKILPGGPTFRGDEFSLVDCAFAPLFMRVELFSLLKNSLEWNQLPKTKQWAEGLLQLDAVQRSVDPDFKTKMLEYLKKRQSVFALSA